jgi:hypothetical protein
MSRPTFSDVVSALEGWDAELQDNFDILKRLPWPITELDNATAGYANLAAFYAAYPAASYSRCIAMVKVNDQSPVWNLYQSDGSAWSIFGSAGPATQIIETSGPTTLDIAGITDGEFLKRVGTDIVSAVPTAGPATQIDETSGPTTLDIAAIADGEFLKRVGTDIVSGPATADPFDLAFFDHNGFLPAAQSLSSLYDFPTPDFTNDNGGTRSLSMSRMRFLCGSGAVGNYGWDLGAAKTKILAIFGALRGRNASIGVFFSSTLPAAGEIPDGCYLFNLNSSGSRLDIYKRASGSFGTALANDLTWGPGDTVDEPSTGVACYYDDSTDRLILFVRTNGGMWAPVVDVTDSSFTTMRYIGIRNGAVGTPVMWAICPVAFYSEA